MTAPMETLRLRLLHNVNNMKLKILHNIYSIIKLRNKRTADHVFSRVYTNSAHTEYCKSS